MLAEQITALPIVRYTCDVPVLTPDLLERLKQNSEHTIDTEYKRHVDNIHFSETPNVFCLPDPDLYGLDGENYEVRVWRNGLPEQVKEFIACALEIMGCDATQSLPSSFALNEEGMLTDTHATEIDMQLIAAPYVAVGIKTELAIAFADHFVQASKSMLEHLPQGFSLNNVTHDTDRRYRTGASLTKNQHRDGYHQVIFHYCDPATPYYFGPAPMQAVYRTQAGDITLHGNCVRHGMAVVQAAVLPDRETVSNSDQPRFIQIYQVQHPTLW